MTIREVNELNELLAHCKGQICLISAQGEQYSLNDEHDRFIGLSRLLEDQDGGCELYARTREDNALLLDFFIRRGSLSKAV